jgi:mercuric ion transport protein
VSGLLIALGFVNTYFIAPRLKTSDACEPGDIACGEASRLSKVALWVSLGLYSIGFFVAYVLGPVLARLDQ